MGNAAAPERDAVALVGRPHLDDADTVLRLRPRTILLVCGAIIFVLVDLSVVACFPQLDHTGAFFRFAALDSERGIGTLYAVVQLGLAATAAFVVGVVLRRHRRPWARHWFALGVLLVLVMVDEHAAQHERITPAIHHHWATHGFLYFAWTIPAAVLVLVLMGSFARFVVHLPRPVRGLVVGAAALFVAGALGLEALSGWFVDRDRAASVAYELTATFEEFLELAGVALLLYATCRHLVEDLPPVWATTAPGGSPPARPDD